MEACEEGRAIKGAFVEEVALWGRLVMRASRTWVISGC